VTDDYALEKPVWSGFSAYGLRDLAGLFATKPAAI
jgi:hypothetical protein